MRLIMLLLLICGISQLALAADAGPKEKTWWEKRDQRSDIFYPHNIHMDAMEQMGDSCMLCHSFAKTDIVNPDKLNALSTIANEPLKAVCHSCHVEDRRAPWRCNLCHDDKRKIWPDDHNFGYVDHHGEDARRDEQACRECHLDTAFCTNCHFRRDTMGTGHHPLGYRTLHGMEARMSALECGRCHNANYCTNCHEATR